MTSNFLDIIYIVISGLSLAAGLYTGATKLIIGFVFFLLSFVFAYFIFVPVTDVMHEYISSHFMLSIISGAVSYLVCAVFCAVIASKLKTLVEDISGGVTDRFVGLVLGGVRGVIVSLVIFTIVTIFTSKSYATAKNVLELIVGNSAVETPHWVSSSNINPELRHLLDQAIDFVGKDSLKKLLIPKHEVSVVPAPVQKDPFAAMDMGQ